MEITSEYSFWGEFEHGVDDKGRVIMPQDFRGSLGDEFIVVRGPDHAIWAFPMDVWKRIQDKLRDPVMNRSAAFLHRMMGGRTIVKLDPQSRLAIPKHLREWARITPSHSVVIIGQGQKLEIWEKDIWDKFNDEFTTTNLFDAAEKVGLSEEIN